MNHPHTSHLKAHITHQIPGVEISAERVGCVNWRFCGSCGHEIGVSEMVVKPQIHSVVVDTREAKAQLVTKLQEAIMERREQSGLGVRLTLPHEDVLEHGDIMIVVENPTWTDQEVVRIVMERKTTPDAYNNWHPPKKALEGTGKADARLDNQLWDMLEWERTDIGALIFESRYMPAQVYKQPKYWRFLRHINYIEMCVMPVIRTRSLKDTALHIAYFMEKILNGDFMKFIRPVQLINEGNVTLSMLGQMPDVGTDLAKKIKEKFLTWQMFLTACEEHMNLNSDWKSENISHAKAKRDSKLCQIKGIGWDTATQIALLMVGKW